MNTWTVSTLGLVWMMLLWTLVYKYPSKSVISSIFLGSNITVDGDCSHKIKRWLLLGRKAMTNLDSILKSRDIILPKKVCIFKAMVFPVVIYGFESWCFPTVMLEKTLERSLDGKEIKPVNPEGNHPWVFIGRTDVEAPVLWLPDGKNRVIGKGPDAWKDWGQEEKGAAEDEMVR